jgi:hypothetical protein
MGAESGETGLLDDANLRRKISGGHVGLRGARKYRSLSAPSAGEAIAVAGLARKAPSSGSGSAGMMAPSALASTC